MYIFDPNMFGDIMGYMAHTYPMFGYVLYIINMSHVYYIPWFGLETALFSEE